MLKWNDHHASFFTIVEDLCRTEQLCDVTLACGGQVFETHKLILSVCSPYFRTLLNSRPDKHPIVYLKDVNPKHLEQLLSYMYRGEINVLQDDLGPLIETARGLQIKVRDCEILPGLVWCPCWPVCGQDWKFWLHIRFFIMLVSRPVSQWWGQTSPALWRQFDNLNNVRAWRMRVMGTPGKRQKAATMAASLVILSINQSDPEHRPRPRRPRLPALRGADRLLSCPAGW